MKKPNLYKITIQHYEGFITKTHVLAENIIEAPDKVLKKVGPDYKVIEVIAVQENIII